MRKDHQNKTECANDDVFVQRSSQSGFNLKLLSTASNRNGNLIQIRNSHERSQSMHNLYPWHSGIGGNEFQSRTRKMREESSMNQLLNPQSSHKNNNDESWLILLCGSNPLIGAVHIEIIKEKNVKLNSSHSQSVTNWFSETAKSLFRSSSKSSHHHQNVQKIKRSQSSPSKGQKIVIGNNQKQKNQKRKSREQILLKQKQTQHSIRDEKYTQYSTKFVLRNEKFCSKHPSSPSSPSCNENVSIMDIVMSPRSEYGAFTDSFGRIWIWDCTKCQFVRLFKGYRRAQIAVK